MSITPTIGWVRQLPVFNTSGAEYSPSIALDANANIYIAYYAAASQAVSGGTRIFDNDIIVFKLNSSGIHQWNAQIPAFNTSGSDLEPSIVCDNQGNCYITYETNNRVTGGTNGGGTDIVVFKLNTNGAFQWSRQLPTFNTTGNEKYPRITCDSLNNVYITYATNGTVSGGTNVGGYDMVLLKLNSDGVFQWTRQLPAINTTGDEVMSISTPPAITIDQSNDIYITYTVPSTFTISGGTRTNFEDIAVVKISDGGAFVWSRQLPSFNTSGLDIWPNITTDTSSNIYVAYQTRGTVSGGTKTNDSFSNNIAVFKLNKSGVFEWVKQLPIFNTTGNNLQPAIDCDSVNNVYVTYDTQGTVSGGTNNGSSSMVMFKLDTNGNHMLNYQNINLTGITGGLSDIEIDTANNIYMTFYVSTTVSGGTKLGNGVTDIAVVRINNTNAGAIPTGLTVTNTTSDINGSRQSVSWSAVSDRLSYDIQRATDINFTQNVITNNQTSTSYTSSSLSPSTTYFYRVRSTNINGTVGYSTPVSLATLALAPTGLSVLQSSPFRHDLSWPNTGITYQIQRSPSSSFASQVNTYTNISTNTFTSVDFAPHVTYYYRFKVLTPNESEYSTSLTVTPLATSTFSVAWVRQLPIFNTSGNDANSDISIDSQGNSYITYHTEVTISGGTNTGSSDIVLFKLDSNGNHLWNVQNPIFNTSGFDFNPSITLDNNKNIIVAYASNTSGFGVFGGTGSRGRDIIVFKLDSNGNHLWNAQNPVFNTSANDLSPRITSDANNNIYVVYYAENTGVVSGGTARSGSDIIVFKLNSNGEHLWNAQNPLFNTTAMSYDPDIAVDANANVYVTYFNNGVISGGTNIGGANDIVVFKLNSAGIHQWSKQLPVFNTSGGDVNSKLAVDKFGNVYVSYNTGSTGVVSGGTRTGSWSDIVIFKLNTNGEIEWSKQIPFVINSTSRNEETSITTDNNGNIYVSYITNPVIIGGTVRGGDDIAVLRFNTDGELISSIQHPFFNTLGTEVKPRIKADISGNVYVTYYTTSTISGGTNIGGLQDIVVFKLSSSTVSGISTITTPVAPNTSYATFLNNNVANITDRKLFKEYMRNNKSNFTGASDGIALVQGIVGANTTGLYEIQSVNLDLTKNVNIVTFNNNDTLNINSTLLNKLNKGEVLHFLGSAGDIINLNIDETNYQLQFTTSGILYNSVNYVLDNKLTFGTLQLYLRAFGSGGLQGNENSGICFLEDTLIKTIHGEKKIQDLRATDIIINYYGNEVPIKYLAKDIVEMENIKSRTKVYPYIIPKDSIKRNYPSQDTYASPTHTIYVSDKPYITKKLKEKYGENIKQVFTLDKPLVYYNIVLDTEEEYEQNSLYFTMYANNMLVETCNPKNRKLKAYTKIY